jgi:hypothetical protein
MDKIDVAIQSYKKPELLFYTLLSLKKFCGSHIETVFINDDCSGQETLDFYNNPNFANALWPIKVKIRINQKKAGYSKTLMTKELLNKKKINEKFFTLVLRPLKHLDFHDTENDIRYQWAINNTNKKHLLIIHDDIKFYDDVVETYLSAIEKDPNLAIVGDLGNLEDCPFGPCGTKECGPNKILNGYRPTKNYPIVKSYSFAQKLLHRNFRCRINEWLCMINIEKARFIHDKYGTCFGNYEFGGDVGAYWFEKIIKEGFHFDDPYPIISERDKHYKHWWLGFEGHEVWVNHGSGIRKYPKDYIISCINNDFGVKI